MLCAVFFSTSVLAEHPTADDPPQVTVDIEQGRIVYEELNLTGTYIDEELPISISWRIYSDSVIVDSGSLMNSLELLPVNQSSRDIWSYNALLDFSEFSDCSCLIEIEAKDSSQQSYTSQLIVFKVGESGQSPSPRVIFSSTQSPSKLSLISEISIIARDDSFVPNIQWALSDDSEIALSCALSWIEEPNVNWTNVSTYNLDAGFDIDTTEYMDGSYSLLLRAVVEDEISIAACRTIGIDNQFPSATITGPTQLNETANLIQFDGSSSSDAVWGRESLVFLWVLEGGNDGPEVVSGTDLSTFSVDGSKAGNFSLTLTVVDEVGFTDTTNHVFTIVNQNPIASLRIGGQALSDGDRITLIDSQQWLIECDDSTDTTNDQSSLTCIWSIDDVPTMTGWARQLQKPSELDNPHTLTLLVVDNDGANDSITVTFGVQGTPSDPMYSSDEASSSGLVMQVIAVIASLGILAFTAIFVSRRYTGHSGSIPKWKRE